MDQINSTISGNPVLHRVETPAPRQSISSKKGRFAGTWAEPLLQRKFLIPMAVTIGIISMLALVKFFQVRAIMAHYASFSMPPEAVATLKVEPAPWQPILSYVGALSPVQGVTLKAELAGRVVKINFESGSKVRKGDVLVELDSGNDVASLKNNQAQALLAKNNFERAKMLLKSGAYSKLEYDQAEALYNQTRAMVDASVSDVNKKKIVAPFDGRVGIREVNLGQFVDAGGSIVSLQSLDPIYADFSVPQQQLGMIKLGQTVEVTIDAFADKIFHGKVSALDPDVNPTTRNVRIQATLANADGQLRPGMFIRVGVLMPSEDKVITIPASAVAYAPYGDSVYVLEEQTDPKNPKAEKFLGVRQQFIKLGNTRGDQVAVLTGLKGGDEVVTAGQFKLRPGVRVVVNNSIVPTNNPAPKPPDT